MLKKSSLLFLIYFTFHFSAQAQTNRVNMCPHNSSNSRSNASTEVNNLPRTSIPVTTNINSLTDVYPNYTFDSKSTQTARGIQTKMETVCDGSFNTNIVYVNGLVYLDHPPYSFTKK